MKNLLLIMMVLMVFMAGCGKKNTCRHSIDYRQPAIAFVGFDRETIKAAVMTRYKPNTNFSQVIDSIPADTSSFVFEGDTTFRSVSLYFAQGFFYIDKGADYKIRLGNPAMEYSISNITSGEEEEIWTQTESCSPGSTQSKITTFNLQLNGMDYTPSIKGVNAYFIYLKH